MPNFGRPFANEGKGTGNESNDRRGALSSDEITTRLYPPKPADAWRRDEPSTVAASVQPAAEPAPAATPAVAEPEPVVVSPFATGAPAGNGQAAAVAEQKPLAAAPISVPTEMPASTPAMAAIIPEERLVSVISKNSVFDGNYVTDGDVRVEGEVKGDITCKGHVLICDGATVNAKISATSIAVAGRLSGEVTCSERFEAQPTARITSQISTPRLVIQEGAVVDGQIKMGVQD